MKKNDLILAAVILLAAGLFFCFRMSGSTESAVVTVSVDGEIRGRYDLDSEQTISINETNRIRISSGSVTMEWADCPDQICVSHRAISKDGESIICLPNRIVISIESAEEADVDGMTR